MPSVTLETICVFTIQLNNFALTDFMTSPRAWICKLYQMPKVKIFRSSYCLSYIVTVIHSIIIFICIEVILIIKIGKYKLN